MEHSAQPNFEAILTFLESLELLQEPLSINHLVDGCLFHKMLSTIEQFSFPEQKLVEATNWAGALTNNKTLISHITLFYTQQFQKELEIEDIDLFKISKRKDSQQVQKLFFLILATVVQSTAKEYFISKLTSLDTEHQKYFMRKIQSHFDTSSEGRGSNKQLDLLRKVSEVEHQNQELREELTVIIEQNKRQKVSLSELEEKVILMSGEMEKLREQKELGQQKAITIPKYQVKTIQKLKEKIKSLLIQHSQEITKYQQQISILSTENERIIELEKIIENYKESYEEAIDHIKEMGSWNQEKFRFTKQLEEKNTQIKELEDVIQSSNQKIQQLQEQLLQLQISHQKLTLRNNELQSLAAAKKHNTPRLSLAIDRTSRALSQLIPETNQQNLINSDLQKQIESKNKKLQSLEKENEKLRFKVERVTQIEKEKTLLETLIMEQNQSRLDQIELLIGSLYDLRMRYNTLYDEKRGKC